MICGPTKKRGFKTEKGAINRIQEIFDGQGIENKHTPNSLRAYKCEYCGNYHLTSKESRGSIFNVRSNKKQNAEY